MSPLPLLLFLFPRLAASAVGKERVFEGARGRNAPPQPHRHRHSPCRPTVATRRGKVGKRPGGRPGSPSPLVLPRLSRAIKYCNQGARRLRKIESTRLHTARAFFNPSFLRWFLSKAISAETAFVPLYRIPRYIEYLNPRALTMLKSGNLTTSCLSEICPTT